MQSGLWSHVTFVVVEDSALPQSCLAWGPPAPPLENPRPLLTYRPECVAFTLTQRTCLSSDGSLEMTCRVVEQPARPLHWVQNRGIGCSWSWAHPHYRSSFQQTPEHYSFKILPQVSACFCLLSTQIEKAWTDLHAFSFSHVMPCFAFVAGYSWRLQSFRPWRKQKLKTGSQSCQRIRRHD